MATTTKPDITMAVQQQAGTTQRQSSAIVQSVLDTIVHQLELGESVRLSGFGTFSLRAKGARRGRNPRTGGQAEISARKVVVFKPSHILQARAGYPPTETV